MRLLTVRHITTYHYAEPVALGEHRMMFRPRESHDLRLVRSRLDISPKPRHIRWLHDVFDNSLAIADFGDPITELVFDSSVTLEHVETSLPNYLLEADAEEFPFRYSEDERPDLVRGLHRHYPAAEVDDWAAKFLMPSGSTRTIGLLQAMTHGIRSTFTYERRVARGVQTPRETLARGKGSCRDFALLMMEAVRSLGLAARFVSGYIYTPQAPGEHILGGGATHAWLQVYLPGAGWVDFDPTNSIIGNRNLIRVAVAWDPAQAVPLWGTYFGSANAFLGMDVTVTVLDESSMPKKQPANGAGPVIMAGSTGTLGDG